MLKCHDPGIFLASSGVTGQGCILSRPIAQNAIVFEGYNDFWSTADSSSISQR